MSTGEILILTLHLCNFKSILFKNKSIIFMSKLIIEPRSKSNITFVLWVYVIFLEVSNVFSFLLRTDQTIEVKTHATLAIMFSPDETF